MALLFACVFSATLTLALGVHALALGRHRRVLDLLTDMQRRQFAAAHGQRVAAALRRHAAGALRRGLDRVAQVVRTGPTFDAARRLQWAGLSMSGQQFVALRLLAAAAGASAGLAAGGALLGLAATVPAGCLGALAGHLLPDWWLAGQLARRREAIDRELLYFLDFLALAAQAGLTVEQALACVAREFPGLLSTAFAQAGLERRLGQWDEHALGGLADRLGHAGVRQVVEALVRSGRFGSRSAAVLRDVAGSIRQQRNEAAREHAARSGAAIVLPVAVFIMPAIVLVLGYPALALISGALGSG